MNPALATALTLHRRLAADPLEAACTFEEITAGLPRVEWPAGVWPLLWAMATSKKETTT